MQASTANDVSNLVESVRENGRTKQRIIRNLGRKEAVLASGALDRLIATIGRFAERSLVLRVIEEGDERFEVRRIGAPLLFGRLWEESGCRAVVSKCLAGRGFGFEVERAVFVAVLHRLMVSASDRFCVHLMGATSATVFSSTPCRRTKGSRTTRQGRTRSTVCTRR